MLRAYPLEMLQQATHNETSFGNRRSSEQTTICRARGCDMKDYPLPKIVYVVVYPDDVRREYLPMVRQRMEGQHQPAAMLFSHSELAQDAMICSCPFGYILRVKSPDELLLHLDVFEHLGLNCIAFDPVSSDAGQRSPINFRQQTATR